MISNYIFSVFVMIFFLNSNAYSCSDVAHLMSEKFSNTSLDEIKDSQKSLAKIESVSDVKDNAEGTSVFIARVVSSKNVNKNQDAKVNLQIERVIYGASKKAKYINVYTPLNNQGIDFKVGVEYKIAALNIQGCYWTWAWTGTYQIDR